jgi:outer membrane protein assembly factor BamB
LTAVTFRLLPAKRCGAALAAGLLALALTACEDSKTPLPGERVSVLQLNKELNSDPSLSETPVRLPKPYENKDWPQSGGNQAHAMYHLSAGTGAFKQLWSASIGSSADSANRLLAEPVVADGKIFTLDSESLVRVFDAETGKRIWENDLTPDTDDDGLFGGGIAVYEGKVFVTTPFAKLIALDEKDGKKVWEVDAPSPMRAPPAASDGRIFTVTIDNQLVVYASDDGRRLWSNTGVEEAAGFLGGATPAVLGDVVVAAYTSGDLLAFDVVTGRSLWSDNLAGRTGGNAVAALTDIRGRPVIDRDRVIAIGNGGVMAAIDLRRGGRIWDNSLGGTQMPWAAGDFLFVITSSSEVVCLTREDGRIKWVQALPPFEDMEDKEDPIYWSGPVLVEDRLLVTGSNGVALAFSPYTGKLLGKQTLPDRSHLPPVVANKTVYMLSDDADLIALR